MKPYRLRLVAFTITGILLASCGRLGRSAAPASGPEDSGTAAPPDSTFTTPSRIAAAPLNAIDLRGFAWSHGDWCTRVVWEARHALSASASGVSNWPVSQDSYGPRWYGDWNYVASDAYAYGKAAAEAGGVVGGVADASTGQHRGGWCTYFVRLILMRATYWAGFNEHLTTPGFPGSVYSWTNGASMTQDYGSMRPGFVFSSPGRHMAIADVRATVNGRIGWYVIDANYVGGDGNFFIGRHFLPDTVLKANNYWGWYPSWATTN
jgi:hypothetical protein